MKHFNFTALDNSVSRGCSPRFAPALIIAVTLTLGNQSLAGEYPFQVVYADVPGASEVEAGHVQAGIRILEDQLYQVEQENSGDVWATLCAAYIVNASLGKAELACTKAVETSPTYSAFNNRGVFRVFTGELTAAREDFERVRPRQLEVYLEKLTTKDVRVIADGNFHLINKLSARHRVAEINASVALSTAEIEDLNN